MLLPVGCNLTLTQSILTVWVGTEHGQYAHLVVMLTFASCIDASQWPLAQFFRGCTTQAVFRDVVLARPLVNLALSIATSQVTLAEAWGGERLEMRGR